MSDNLMAQLDGAKLVKYDGSVPCVLAWFGGHGIHAYNEQGEEFGYWNVGDFADNDADVRVVEESMNEHVVSLDEYPY